MKKATRILITGASGFIGSHLVKEMSSRKDLVIYAVSRLALPPTTANIIPIQADLAKKGWTHVLSPPVDVVIHLAQSRHHRHFPDGAEDMLDVNVLSTLELVDWSRKSNVKRFLLASTGNVYRPTDQMLNESDECHPTSMYAVSKLSAEYIVRQYSGFLDTTIMRIFGVYGPRQQRMLIADLIDRVKTSKTIKIVNKAGLAFTPLYISDCISFIEKLSNLEQHLSGIFNLCGNETVSIAEIVEIISRYLNKSPIIRHIDGPSQSLRGNNRKLCEALKCSPVVPIQQGIQTIILEG